MSTDTQVIQLRLVRAQADLNVAQTFSPTVLGERHAEKLIETTESLDVVIAIVLGNKAPKALHWQMLHQLRRQKATFVHGDILPMMSLRVLQLALKSMAP